MSFASPALSPSSIIKLILSVHSLEGMGKVSLGMPGPWAKDYRETSDHYTTKIGGLPDWPLPDMDIKPDFLNCGQCGNRLCLVSQIYAPISSDTLKSEERVIYVFGCTTQKCASDPLSWRALRVQKSYIEEETDSISAQVISSTTSSESILKGDSQAQNRGESADDVDNADMDLEELGRALYEAACTASNYKKKKARRKTNTVVKGSPVVPPVGVVDTNIPVVPCFYIYSQEESSRDVNVICSNYSSLSINGKENDLDDQREEETWAEESYEYDKALYVDRTYLKFKKRMDAYPEQCFRYWYGGKPLLATVESEVPGKCGSCGSPRNYEMQLMPPLLFFLREASDESTQSPEWNWMTLILYTCSKSCSPPIHQGKFSSNNWTVAEETVIVKFE